MDGEDRAMLPMTEFPDLLEELETVRDIALANQAKTELERGEDEVIPGAVASRLLSGENQVRVWREFRGLTQAQLAELSGLKQATIAQIEGGARTGTVSTLRRIAAALAVDLDDVA